MFHHLLWNVTEKSMAIEKFICDNFCNRKFHRKWILLWYVPLFLMKRSSLLKCSLLMKNSSVIVFITENWIGHEFLMTFIIEEAMFDDLIMEKFIIDYFSHRNVSRYDKFIAMEKFIDNEKFIIDHFYNRKDYRRCIFIIEKFLFNVFSYKKCSSWMTFRINNFL